VVRPNDSRLDPYELKAVEKRARLLLNRASAWDRFPTPIEDLLAAANLQVAPTSIFNPAHLLAYLQHKAAEVKDRIKTALSKILGLYDSNDSLIHIDDTVGKSKQTFLKLHETGHHELPTHRKAFSLFQDCETTLSPDIADLFEREANNFARFILFQGDGYSKLAADHNMGIRVPIDLAKKFGASVYASAREYARTNPHPCLVYALEPVELVPGDGSRALVRRIEASPSFTNQFGIPTDTEINLNHPLWNVIPIGGRKMTSPHPFQVVDRNGVKHACLAESFKTPFNILILLYLTIDTIA
jgi:hypothetical protein